jgi:hypothetical protein
MNAGVLLEEMGDAAAAVKEYLASVESANQAARLNPARWSDLPQEVESKLKRLRATGSKKVARAPRE